MNSIVLIGGFSEMVTLCKDLGYKKIYVIDKKDVGFGTTYLGEDSSLQIFFENVKNFDFCITPDYPEIRKLIYSNYKIKNINFPIIASKGAKISNDSKIGIGTVIQFGSFISNNVVIGDFVKLNVNSCVMHDVSIGSFTTLAPSCTLLGRVNIGNLCYIGTSATVLPGITVCDGVTIGAGAVVTKNIDLPGIYIGIPAKKIISKNEY